MKRCAASCSAMICSSNSDRMTTAPAPQETQRRKASRSSVNGDAPTTIGVCSRNPTQSVASSVMAIASNFRGLDADPGEL